MNGDTKTLQERRFQALYDELGSTLYHPITKKLYKPKLLKLIMPPEYANRSISWLQQFRNWVMANGHTENPCIGLFAHDEEDGGVIDGRSFKPGPPDSLGMCECIFDDGMDATGKRPYDPYHTYYDAPDNRPATNPFVEFIGAHPIPKEQAQFVVIASDFHGRHKDPFLYDAFRSFLRAHAVDRLILNGDIFDGESVSKYAKSNTMSWGDEVKEVGRMLRQLVADIRFGNPGAEIDWIDGNHEERFYKYLAINAPQVAGTEGMATIETLLKMPELGVSYHTAREYVNLPHNVFVQHRFVVNPVGGTSAANSMKKLGGSIIIGDTHRIGSTWKLDRNGLTCGYEIGCMCELDAEYMYKSGANWQNGFMVIRYHGEDQLPEYIQVVAHNGRFAFDGVVYG